MCFIHRCFVGLVGWFGSSWRNRMKFDRINGCGPFCVKIRGFEHTRVFFGGAFKWYAILLASECRNERLKISQRTLEEHVPLWFRQKKELRNAFGTMLECLSVLYVVWTWVKNQHFSRWDCDFLCLCFRLAFSSLLAGPGFAFGGFVLACFFWVVLTFLPSDFRLLCHFGAVIEIHSV